MKINHPERFVNRPGRHSVRSRQYAVRLWPRRMTPPGGRCWTSVLGTLSLGQEEFDAAAGDARSRVKERLGRTASSHSRLLYFQRTLEILGLGSRVLLALDLEQTYWRAFLVNAVLFGGVRELLDDIRILEIPAGGRHRPDGANPVQKTGILGLDNSFDYVVTSEETGFDKPHEAPFRMALEKIQPAGSVVWMIGDDPEADVRGARESIGAVTLQKVHRGVSGGRGDVVPDARFTSFNDVRKFMQRQAYGYTVRSAGAEDGAQ